jgi:uncharacterized cofD-like protein
MALLALAGREDAIVTLARRRFAQGELAGHSLGNLLLLGLLEEHDGDLLAALSAFADLVGAVGQVLPATTSPVTLIAETAAGEVTGQAAVASTSRIRRVRLDPLGAPAATGVVTALEQADLVLLGPGSLYTSILPVLLVDGIARALAETVAHVVLVGNLRAQPGETEGMDLADHVEALLDHHPRLRIDTLLAHEPAPERTEDVPTGAGRRHGPLAIDLRRLERTVGQVVRADLGDELEGHDATRLAALIGPLLSDRGVG